MLRDCFKPSFKRGAKLLMSQPLVDRLTEDEKEMIRAIHFRQVHTAEDVKSNFTEKCLIEAIFGTEIL